ncbi:ATP-dependent DNA ligase [soil metagenome]
MELARLAITSRQLAATRSRTTKRELIATVLRDTGSDELETVVSYLSGTLPQRRTGIGWSALDSLPTPADQASLSVADVHASFERISAIGGPGSAALRNVAVHELFARATASEQDYLRGLVFDELRQGALDSLVQDGLAEAHGLPAAAIRRAAMLLGSTAAAATVIARDGPAGLDAVRLQVGLPVRPMLAASAPDPDVALARKSLPVLVDVKLDGIRVQVHRDGSSVGVWTRSLEDITDRVPEVVEAVLDLQVERVVLDAEVLALGAEGRPAPFQAIAARTASRVDVAAGRIRTPLSLFCFDLLHADGLDLLDAPLDRRAAVMAQLLPEALVVPRVVAIDSEQVAEVFADAVDRGFEGIVVKDLQAPYAAGRRDAAWVKVKPRHTFDLAVTAAEWGHGRRHGLLSNLHLAARDPATGELVMLGKTFKGLTDEILAWQTQALLAREVRRTAGTVHVDPPLVVEIACDGIQTSSRYPGGVTLRFARVLRYREDKSAAEVDTLDSVIRLTGS